jgi:twitching motility protein PilT
VKIDELLRIHVERGASDLHLKVGSPPTLRIGHLLVSISEEKLTPEQTREFALSLLNEEQQRRFFQEKEMEFSYSAKGIGRFRVSLFHQRGSVSLVLRHVPFQIPDFEKLHLPEAVRHLADQHHGLVLVVGQARSGKSTTLSAMLHHINKERRAHIVTIEDPIEFLHTDIKCIVNQREIEEDTSSFAEALRHIVRQDPDVIMIGELRDTESVSAALSIAETGHLVLSTLHTQDAPQTVERIMSFFPPHQQDVVRVQLATVLRGVIAQRLVPRKDEEGLVPAVEIMIVTPFIRKLIEEGKIKEIATAIEKKGEFYGMQTFNDALLRLYREGKIGYEDALKYSVDPERMRLALKGIITQDV